MRKTILPLIIILSLFLSMIGCDNEPEVKTEDKNQSAQQIYFKVEYCNFAWGIQHGGYLIDSIGAVHSFNLPENWIGCDSLGEISAVDMQKNLASCDSITAYKSQLELKEKIKLIGEAAKGTISLRTSVGCDMGSRTYSAFTYNPKTQKYKEVFLRTNGDWTNYNESPEAIELYNWLSPGDPLSTLPVCWPPDSKTTHADTALFINLIKL